MNAPATFTTQLTKLDTLIRTATAARDAARRGDLFASREGIELFRACDRLFDDSFKTMIANAEHELGIGEDA